MNHQHVVLSNGKRLVLVEGKESVSIATVGLDGDIEYYICRLDNVGVRVYTNSYDATLNLTKGLK
jgi:hypothetical protein